MTINEHIEELFKPFKGLPLTPIGRKAFFFGMALLGIINLAFALVFGDGDPLSRILLPILFAWVEIVWFTRRHIDIFPTAQISTIFRNFAIFFIFSLIINMGALSLNPETMGLPLALSLIGFSLIRLVLFLYYLFTKGLAHKKKELKQLLEETKQ